MASRFEQARDCDRLPFKDARFKSSYKNADIVAVGKRNLITEDMVKAGACVIVGTNKDDEECAETAILKCFKKAGYITPSRGVGPMTVACLLRIL